MCHVSLTFPVSRYPPLDFLDNFRTAGVCGVPKSSRSLLTNLKIDEKYNITWKMQYPHQGGFRFRIYNKYGFLVETLSTNNLTSNNDFNGLEDQTLENYEVTFKNKCENCTLQMERQALEWGKGYKFRSCAEINVLDKFKIKCSGKGELINNNVCKCEKKYSGNICQYENDCENDSDCFNNGKCIENGIASNRKVCFCQYGYYGADCQKRSFPVGNESFSGNDLRQCFSYNFINKSNPLFKYGMFNENCFKKIKLNDINGDFLYTRNVENEIEIILDYKTESWLSIGWRPLNIPTTCRLFPDLSTNAIKKNDESVSLRGYLFQAFNADLHPMDCVDVVMASVIDLNFLHISDMYTRDRSTPLDDKYFDGEQSLTAAYGQQTLNGRSIVMFRRNIREIEPTDHPLGPGKIFLIYAKGQTAGDYNQSAIEKDYKKNIKNKEFYKNDQWKYHGDNNRGIKHIELVSNAELRDFKSLFVHPEKNKLARTNTTAIAVEINLKKDRFTNLNENINNKLKEKIIIVKTPKPFKLTRTSALPKLIKKLKLLNQTSKINFEQSFSNENKYITTSKNITYPEPTTTKTKSNFDNLSSEIINDNSKTSIQNNEKNSATSVYDRSILFTLMLICLSFAIIFFL